MNRRGQGSALAACPACPSAERELHAYVTGFGLGVPLVSLITGVRSYIILEDRGRTPWDAAYRLRTEHREFGVGSWLLVALVAFVLVADL